MGGDLILVISSKGMAIVHLASEDLSSKIGRGHRYERDTLGVLGQYFGNKGFEMIV